MTSATKVTLLPAELLSALLPILEEINGVLDPEALLPAIARLLRRILDYEILEIFLPAPDGTLVAALIEGYAPGLAPRLHFHPGQGIIGAAVRDKAPIFVADVSKDPRYIEASPGVRTELAIPLIHRDRLVGVLNVEGADPTAFTTDARTALGVLASHLAIAIANATLHRDARFYGGLLAALYEIGKETASILEIDTLLRRVPEIVKRVIDYDTFGVLLLEGDELVLRESVRFGAGNEKARIPVGEGLVGLCALEKRAILVGDVQNDPRYVNLVPETRSELCVPMIHKDRLLGVFDLEAPSLNRFTEEHVKILTPLASQIAVAVENARLYAELKAKEERLRQELRIAHGIQHALFPEGNPSGPGWEASAHFRPAAEVGGDLYDFYDLKDGRLGVAVGDVAGKGVPAALYGAFTSGTVRGRAFEGYAPSDLMQRVNRTLRRRGAEGLFCTLTYALFDFSARKVTLANSGLPYPTHFRASLLRCEVIELGGHPLGAFDETKYEEWEIPFSQGDVFIFHTDGITEAHRGEEDYGQKRLRDVVERDARLSAAELGERILEDVERFMGRGAPADDLALVVVKIL